MTGPLPRGRTGWCGRCSAGPRPSAPQAAAHARPPARRRPPACRAPAATMSAPAASSSSPRAWRASGRPMCGCRARAPTRSQPPRPRGRPGGLCRGAMARSAEFGGGGRPPTATHGAESGGGRLLSTGALSPFHNFPNLSRPLTTLSTSSVSLRPGWGPPPAAAWGGALGPLSAAAWARAPRRRAHRFLAPPRVPQIGHPPTAMRRLQYPPLGGRGRPRRGAAAPRARARFKSQPCLWVFAVPQWPPRDPNPAHPPRRRSRRIARMGARAGGLRRQANSPLAVGPRRPGETPWRATVAAWSPPQPSLPPAPTSLPRDPDHASPVRRLAVGLVAPLITQTPTLSPRRSSIFRSGPAHRHDSDDVGASLWCALIYFSLGGRASAAVSNADAPLHLSVVLTAFVAAHATFAVRYFGREKERREAAAK